jgi:anti-sigma B factor antagonist
MEHFAGEKEDAMRIQTEKLDRVMVLTPMESSMDASSAPDMKKKMLDLIGQGNRNLVLDFTHVRFMDSTGLGTVISALKAIGHDGDLGLCCIRENIMEIIRLTRLDRALRIFATRADALAALSPRTEVTKNP